MYVLAESRNLCLQYITYTVPLLPCMLCHHTGFLNYTSISVFSVLCSVKIDRAFWNKEFAYVVRRDISKQQLLVHHLQLSFKACSNMTKDTRLELKVNQIALGTRLWQVSTYQYATLDDSTLQANNITFQAQRTMSKFSRPEVAVLSDCDILQESTHEYERRLCVWLSHPGQLSKLSMYRELEIQAHAQSCWHACFCAAIKTMNCSQASAPAKYSQT